jgi:hypothetical protein
MQRSDEQLKPPSKPTVELVVIRVCYVLPTNSNEVLICNSYPIFQPIENFNGSHFEASGGNEAVLWVPFQPYLIENN